MVGSPPLILLAVLFGSSWLSLAQTGPPYCSYSEGWFTCLYAVMPSANRPIDYTQFSIPPQLMEMSVNGFMPYIGDTRSFSSTFETFDKAAMDTNSPIVLTLHCGWNGALYVGSGAFYNMSHVQILHIKNCNIYNIPSYGFEGLTNLDTIWIDSGTIDYIDPNGMAGLNVEKQITDTHQPPQLFGNVGLANARFTSGVVPPGFLYSWKNLTSARFENTNISTITSDTFRYNSKLRLVDLSDNPLGTLPSGLWSGLDSLSEVTLRGIDWSCTCANLWFIDHARENNITLFGDLICSTGGMTATKYYYENCLDKDVCAGKTGIAIGTQCELMLGMIISSLATVALILVIVALILTCMNMRTAPGKTSGRRRPNGKNRWKDAATKAKLKNAFNKASKACKQS